MARLVTGDRLRQAVVDKTFIKGGDPNCAEGVKYDFRLSSHILRASFGRPIDADRLTETEKTSLVVEPGEMVFALTEEHLDLPDNMIAQLSPKRKMSHSGILVVGGFCVDPKYVGPLLIGLFNFSSTKFDLLPGRKVIASTFFELEDGEQGDFPAPEKLGDFPVELIQMMSRYRASSVPALADAVSKLRAQVNQLSTDISSHEQWYRRFEDSLEGHSRQIGDLLQGLTAEKDARTKGEDKITEALHKLEGTLWWLKGASAVVGVIVSAVGIPILVNIVSKWLAK